VTKVRAIFISSVLGTIDFHQQYLVPIYSTSKAALNHIVRDIAIKFPHFGTFLVHPGYVKTRLTGGLGDITVSESSQGVYDILDKEAFAVNSTKHLLSYDGSHPAW
jgi:NAD(P)-dependent dehydrogenase (short-subunit alcohol dehydrogenase family)